jgi:hypothetical protein
MHTPDKKIPKIIHTCWAGGTKLMPDKERQNILDWAKANISGEFEIWVWTDKRSYPGGEEALKKNYTETFHQSKQGKEDLVSLNPDFTQGSSPFKLKDVQDEGVATTPAMYEMKKLRPNYGASSDLLRYAILQKFGGAYFDSDVRRGTLSLTDSGIFDRVYLDHQLFLETNSQGAGLIGNDSFITTAGNPFFAKLLQKALDGYMLSESDSITAAYMMDDISKDGYFESITIKRTGPSVVQDLVPPSMTVSASDFENTTIVISPMVFQGQGLTTPVTNSRNWTAMPITQHKDWRTALDAIKFTIAFELDHFKILRLDDHIDNLAKACGMSPQEAERCIYENIKSILDISKLNELRTVQLTYNHPETERFCKAHELLQKTFTIPNTDDYVRILKLLTQHDMIRSYDANPSDLNKLKTPQLADLQKTIEKGMIFLCGSESQFDDMFRALPTLTQLRIIRDNLEEFKDIVGSYKKVAIALNKLNEEDRGAQIDISKLDRILDRLEKGHIPELKRQIEVCKLAKAQAQVTTAEQTGYNH